MPSRVRSPGERVGLRLVRWLLGPGRVPYLVALGLATAALAFQAAQVGVDQDNEALNTRDPEQVALYERFRQSFGSDEDLLLAVTHPDLLGPGGLSLLDALTARLRSVDGVRHVFSLTNARELRAGEMGAEPAPLVSPPYDAGTAQRLGAALDRNPDFDGLLVSRDRRTAGLLIELEDRPGDPDYRSRVIAAVRSAMQAYRGDGVDLHVTGIAVQKHDVSAYVSADQRILMPLALVVLGLVLFAFFRSVLGVVLPLAVTGVSVAWTLGAYGLAGLQVNPITALLPPIVMVLSVAVSVHLIRGWQEPGDGSSERVERILEMVGRLLFPCFLCALTTAFGFASLLTSELPAVQYFGAFAALGAMVAFFVGITLVPVGLSFAPPRAASRGPRLAWLDGLLSGCAEMATRRPGRVLLAFGLLTAVSLPWIPRIQNNTDLVRFLKEGAPLRRDTRFIDENLTGTQALEFVVERRDGEPLTTLDAVRKMAGFEQAALGRKTVTGVTSILAILRQLQRAEWGGDGMTLPDNERDTAYAFDLIEAAPDDELVAKMISDDFRRARFNVRLVNVGTAVAAPLADGLLDEARHIFGDAYRVSATGAFYHVAQDSNRLVWAQVRSFSLAMVLVFVAIGALFRSPRLLAIALVSNVMPIAWTGGLMGAFRIDLSTGTAMIASAVLGLVVDDTIHFLTRYSRELEDDPGEAIRRTTRGVGMPLTVNNLVLVLGFWVGCFGSFKPTIYFSLLSGVTMITALLCDLLVTPACLMLLRRRAPGPA